MTEEAKQDRAEKRDTPPHRVRLPGFLIEEEIGLGDVIKRATSVVGLKPCGGCARRADGLNRWIVFSSRRSP